MGCGSSKAVAPASAGVTPASPLKDSQGAAPQQTDVATLHKQRLEQQHSQKSQTQQPPQQQGELSLPGRIESTTAPAPPSLLEDLPEVVDLPPLRKDPASAAANAEFDYDKELKQGAALGGGGPGAAAAQGAVVGGLLSKQPDWLRGSNTDPAADAAKPVGPTSAQAAPAGKATSSLPPLVGRGMGAPAAGSLPPLVPGGARALAPLGSQHKPQELVPSGGSSGHLSQGSAESAAAASKEQEQQATDNKTLPAASKSGSSSSRSSSPEQQAASITAAAPQAHSHDAAPADPWNSLQSQYAGGSPSPDSMAGSPLAAVSSLSAAPIAAHGSGAAAAAGGSSLPPLHGSSSAVAGGGSRRVTATAKQQQESQELVVEDSDEEATEPKQQQSSHQHQQPAEPSDGTAVGATLTSTSSFAGRLSAQSSQRSVSSAAVPHVAKSGGWGVGSLAGAGTIMLGAESSSNRVPARKLGPVAPSAAPRAQDDVFGDDEEDPPEAPVLPRGFGAANAAAGAASSLGAEASSGSTNLRSSHSRMRVGQAAPEGGGPAAAASAAAAQQDTLDVEEIEDDVDAMIESEMARDGLPADLAAKLAAFEAMGAEEGGSEDGGGAGSDGEGPSVYAMMNNRQGSWRAA